MNWFEGIYNNIHYSITIWSLITILVAIYILFSKKRYWKYFWFCNFLVFMISMISLLIYYIVEAMMPTGFTKPIILTAILYDRYFIICMLCNYLIYKISLYNNQP